MKKIILWFLVIFSMIYYWGNVKQHLFFLFDLFWSLEVIWRVIIVGVVVYLGTIKNYLKTLYNEYSTLINSIVMIVLISLFGLWLWNYENLRNIIIAIGLVGFVWIAMIFGNE